MSSHTDQHPVAKQRGAAKTARNPIPIVPAERLPKPAWIRVKAPGPGSRFHEIKQILREARLHTVCEEAACPNIGECFGKGTATFMILGDLCTRRCPFCDVAHGRPKPADPDEPLHLAQAVARLRLGYVVITSVDRDDLRDGGAGHFAACIRAVREHSPQTRIEVSGARFSRAAGSGARCARACAPGRDEPQPRNRSTTLQAGASGCRLRALAAAPPGVQGAASVGADQVGADGRPRRDRRRDRRK